MFLTTFLSGCKAIYKPKGRKKFTPFPNHSHPGLHSLELKHSFKFFLEEGINFRSQLPATYPTKQVGVPWKIKRIKTCSLQKACQSQIYSTKHTCSQHAPKFIQLKLLSNYCVPDTTDTREIRQGPCPQGRFSLMHKFSCNSSVISFCQIKKLRIQNKNNILK